MISLKIILSSIYLLVLFDLKIANGYKLDKYYEFIMAISGKSEYKADFENNIQKLLKQEPDYFNYTPFNQEYKFECQTEGFTSAVVPKSVHELRPGDINVLLLF